MIGVDLGKRSFQLHGAREDGPAAFLPLAEAIRVVFRRRLRGIPSFGSRGAPLVESARRRPCPPSNSVSKATIGSTFSIAEIIAVQPQCHENRDAPNRANRIEKHWI